MGYKVKHQGMYMSQKGNNTKEENMGIVFSQCVMFLYIINIKKRSKADH